MTYGTGTWPPALQEVIDEFADVEDAMERFEMLFEFAQELDELPISEWSESTKVHGCQSEAHILATLREDGMFHLRGAADAKLVQGLISITAIALEGLSLGQVATFPHTFVGEMGLLNALTPSRANGFRNMLRKVQKEALALEGE